MGRFLDDYNKSTEPNFGNNPVPVMANRFLESFQAQQGENKANFLQNFKLSAARKPTGTDITNKFIQRDVEVVKTGLNKAKSGFGGFLGKVGRVLSAPSQAVTGLVEAGLEKAGILKQTGANPIEAVKKQESNIDLLKRVGQETGKGGLLTGQYDASQNVWGNFVRELPSVGAGLLADIYIDPLRFINPAKTLKPITTAGREAIAAIKEMKVGERAVKDIPAVQKIVDMLGRAFVVRYGQRPEFQNADSQRLINEMLAREEVADLTSPVIHSPKVMQQRVAQVMKGSVTTNEEVKALAQPIRQEFDRVGESISSMNPDLLSPAKFEANKGTYFPRLFTKYEFGTEEEMFKQFFSPRTVSTPRDRFKTRLTDYEWARSLKPDLENTEARIAQLQTKVSDMVERRMDQIKQLGSEIAKLEKEGLRTALKRKEQNAFETYSAILKERGGTFFRKATELSEKVGKDVFTQVKATGAKLLQPSLKGRKVKENIDRLIFSPDEMIARLKRTVGKKDSKINDLLNEIDDIKTEYLNDLKELPTMKEIRSLADKARKMKGEIQEAGYPSIKGLTQLRIVEARQKFFQEISRIASDELKPGWIQLSDDKALGALRNKFLPKGEYRAITQLRRTPTEFEELYSKALQMWKLSKTAYNPATISRNDLTNFLVLNPLGGVGAHRVDIYAKTLHEMMSNGDLYQMARKQGLSLSSFAANELVDKAKVLYNNDSGIIKQFFPTFKKFHDRVVKFYGSQDEFFKLANFIKGVSEDGLTPAEAMKRANFYLVDYSQVPDLVAWLRKSPIGIPFISFTYGVSKPLAKTLLETPHKLANYFKVLNAIQTMDLQKEEKPDIEFERSVLPDWIQEGTYMRLPVTDKYGRSQYVNLQYILPFNILETNSLVPNSPVLSIVGGLVFNRNFFGKDITNDLTDTPEEKRIKQVDFIMTNLVPALAPFGYSYEKVKALIQGRPEKYTGYTRDALQVMLDVLGGIKITPIDPSVEAARRTAERRKEIEALKGQLRAILLDKSIFPEEKQKEAAKIQEKINKVNE